MAGTAVTSAGFQNTNIALWGLAPFILLAVFMLIGGPQGSASGSLKLERIIVAFENLV